MVHSVPVAGFLVILKERELGYPKQVILIGDDFKPLCNGKAQSTQHRQHGLLAVGYYQHDVTLFGTGALVYGFHFVCSHKLCKGAVGLILHPADKGKTLCAYALGFFGKLINFLARVHACGVFGGYGSYRAAVFNRIGKYAEATAFNYIGDIPNFHIKAGIGLVRPVAFHSFGICKPRQRGFNIHAQYFLKQAFHIALGNRENILFFHK